MKWNFVIRNIADNVEVPKKQKYNATVLDSNEIQRLKPVCVI